MAIKNIVIYAIGISVVLSVVGVRAMTLEPPTSFYKEDRIEISSNLKGLTRLSSEERLRTLSNYTLLR